MRRAEPEPHLEPKDPLPALSCDICGEGISEGDGYYVIDGRRYCESCIEDLRRLA